MAEFKDIVLNTTAVRLETIANMDINNEVINENSNDSSLPTSRVVYEALKDIGASGIGTVDQIYNPESENAQSGKAVAEAASDKQDSLVSGINIKTINNQSILGSGNITIEGGSDVEVDQTYNPTSENAQSGKAVAEAVSKEFEVIANALDDVIKEQEWFLGEDIPDEPDTPIEKEYKVIYHANYDGADPSFVEDSKMSAETSVDFILIENPFTRNGYSFKGWSFDQTASLGIIDQPGQKTTIHGKANYYAIWEENTPDTPDTPEMSGDTGNCTWSLDGTVLTISGNSNMGDYNYNDTLPWGTNITEVIINGGVTRIGTNAFKGCSRLINITIPATVMYINGLAFSGCSSLTNVTIPRFVTTIKSGTFQKCSSLTSVTIPVSVKNIETFAFNGCTALTTVNYRGSEADKDGMTIVDDGNNAIKNATWVYNYAG